MIYTNNIQKAIRFATTVHEVPVPQKRKGKDTPYITHPLTVGLILSQAGASEEVVIAGILHDTIEDCVPYGSVTREHIEKEFGLAVAELVDSVTEQNKSLSWAERKALALEHLKHFSHDSLLLKSADILANGTELVDDFNADGDSVFERFNVSRSLILESHLTMINGICTKWPKNPLITDLRELAIQLERIQALGSGDLAYADWTVSFIEYEMSRAYADSPLRAEILVVCSDFHSLFHSYESNHDVQALISGISRLKETFHMLILQAEQNGERMVHILLTSHVGDILYSVQNVLPSRRA